MRTTRRVMLLSAGTSLGALAAPAIVRAQAPLTLKMAHIYVPGNIWYDAAAAYATAVAERSGGRVRIDIAHSGATGDWPASIEGLLIGTNDIVLQSIGTLDRYNTIAGIEAYPYLVRDLAHFRTIYGGPAGAALFDEIAAKTRFRIIGAGYRGARHLSSNKRVDKVEDLRGLKLRVPPLKMYRLTWELLGASPVPMGVAELFTSLQQGVVDGQENPLEVIESLKFNEVQRYVIETSHVIGAMTFIFSEARMRGLPEATRTLLREEGEKAMAAATERMVGLEAELKTRLTQRGMTFVAVDLAPFRARLAPMTREFPELASWVQRIQGA